MASSLLPTDDGKDKELNEIAKGMVSTLKEVGTIGNYLPPTVSWQGHRADITVAVLLGSKHNIIGFSI